VSSLAWHAGRQLWRDLGLIDYFEPKMIRGLVSVDDVGANDRLLGYALKLVRREETSLITINNSLNGSPEVIDY
jgi:hypothetical protein